MYLLRVCKSTLTRSQNVKQNQRKTKQVDKQLSLEQHLWKKSLYGTKTRTLAVVVVQTVLYHLVHKIRFVLVLVNQNQ